MKVIIRHVIWERRSFSPSYYLGLVRALFLSFPPSLSHDGAHIGVGNEERDIVSTARVCSTPVLRGGCNVARKNTVNSTATGPVCLPQKRRPCRSRIWRLIPSKSDEEPSTHPNRWCFCVIRFAKRHLVYIYFLPTFVMYFHSLHSLLFLTFFPQFFSICNEIQK